MTRAMCDLTSFEMQELSDVSILSKAGGSWVQCLVLNLLGAFLQKLYTKFRFLEAFGTHMFPCFDFELTRIFFLQSPAQVLLALL
jgi:hypothetical protein